MNQEKLKKLLEEDANADAAIRGWWKTKQAIRNEIIKELFNVDVTEPIEDDEPYLSAETQRKLKELRHEARA